MSRTLTRASSPRAMLATLALLAVTTACGDASGPATTTTMPIEASTFVERGALVASVTQQPILQQLANDGTAFSVAAARLPLGQRVAALRAVQQLAPLMLRTPDASTPEALRGMLRGALVPNAEVPRAEFVAGDPVVPAEMRGRTLVYTFAEGWTIDRLADGSPRPGAPANGVRFIVQQLDQYGEPTGVRLGFLEIVDNTINGTTRYVVRVVTSAGLVVLQSSTTLGGTDSAPSFSQTGFVTDGTRRIDETFAVTSQGATYRYEAPFAGLQYGFTLTADPMSGVMRLVFDISVDGTRVRMAMTTTETRITTVITVNGAIWARQTATVDAEGEITEGAWTQADGRTPLTGEQLAQLDALGASLEQSSAMDQVDLTASDWIAQAWF